MQVYRLIGILVLLLRRERLTAARLRCWSPRPCGRTSGGRRKIFWPGTERGQAAVRFRMVCWGKKGSALL